MCVQETCHGHAGLVLLTHSQIERLHTALMSPAALESATLAMVPVSETDLMERVRDPRVVDDDAGYGQVVSLKAWQTDPHLIRVWNAPTGSVTAPFNVWWLGVPEVPMEYAQHRYLTKDSASTFLNPDFQMQEAILFAGRLFKRVMYYTCSDPERLLPMVTDALEGFEAQSRADTGWVESSAETLLRELSLRVGESSYRPLDWRSCSA